jgi:hypothetical protein
MLREKGGRLIKKKCFFILSPYNPIIIGLSLNKTNLRKKKKKPKNVKDKKKPKRILASFQQFLLSVNVFSFFFTLLFLGMAVPFFFFFFL